MVDWSKRSEEGITAGNSFCEWDVESDTPQKESFLCQVVLHLLKVETHVEL
jgi:hypothetical protein